MTNIATDLLGKKIEMVNRTTKEIDLSGIVHGVFVQDCYVYYLYTSEDGVLHTSTSDYNYIVRIAK